MCVWQGCVVRCVCVARVCGSTLRVRETTMPSKPKQPAAALITSLSLITCAAVGGWQFTESPRDTLPSQHCRPYPRSELRARSPPYTIFYTDSKRWATFDHLQLSPAARLARSPARARGRDRSASGGEGLRRGRWARWNRPRRSEYAAIAVSHSQSVKGRCRTRTTTAYIIYVLAYLCLTYFYLRTS